MGWLYARGTVEKGEHESRGIIESQLLYSKRKEGDLGEGSSHVGDLK